LLFDDPLAYKNLFININLCDLDMAKPAAWRPGLGAEFTLNKRLYFYADVGITPIGAIGDIAVKKNQLYIEAGSMFSFSSVVKEKSFKLKFREDKSEYSMKIKCNVLKQRGLRGGVISFSTPKEIDGYSPFSSTQAIFAGIGLMKTRNPLVEVEGYGVYNREKRSNFYIDAIISPAIIVNDNTNYDYFIGSASTANPASFPDYKKIFFGYRMGYMTQSNLTFFNSKQGFEFGSRPGIGMSYYFLIKVAFTIGIHIGPKKVSQ
jgi:hypothetical protein